MAVSKLTPLAQACRKNYPLGKSVLGSTVLVLLGLSTLPPALAGVKTPDNTQTYDFDASVYTIEEASLWSANGPGAVDVDWAMTRSQWNTIFGEPASARLAAGYVDKKCALGVCVKTGAAAGLEVEAYALPYFSGEFQPGTFDATAAYKPSIDFQESGLGVDFFKLETDSGAQLGDNAFSVYASSIKLDTGLNIETSVNLFAEACLFGCFIDETYTFIEKDIKLPLLQIDTKGPDGSSGVMFNPRLTVEEAFTLLSGIAQNPPRSLDELLTIAPEEGRFKNLYEDISVLLGRVGEESFEDYRNRLSEDDRNTLDRFIGLKDELPVGVDFSNPYSTDVEGQWAASDAVASATLGGSFLDIRLDVDQVIGSALGLTDGATVSLDRVLAQAGINNVPINAEATLFDLQVGPTLDLKTELELKPELMVHMDFDSPMLIKGKVGAQNSYTGKWDDIPEMALLVSGVSKNTEDSTYNFAANSTASVEFFVESTLSNHTFIDVTAGLEISGLEASIGIKGFDSFSVGPLFNFETESNSIAQVDIIDRTIKHTDWSSTGDNENGRVDAKENNELVTLTFEAAGEVMFQARSVGEPGEDVAYIDTIQDNRIDQTLSVDELIANEKARRGYEFKPDVHFLINVDSVFQFEKDVVEQSVDSEYKIDTGQTAQVMSDGQLVLKNPSDKLIVEVGGSLELGAAHPYAADISGADGQYPLGLTNSGTVEVHGDLYMSPVSTDGTYQFRNDGLTTVGYSGRVKLDGQLENTKQGVIDNYGDVELTSHSDSFGEINNRHLGEFDVYGELALSSGGYADFPGRAAEDWDTHTVLANDGTFTVHDGATVGVVTEDGSERFAEVNNNGEFIVEQGGALVLAEKGVVAGNVTFNNSFLLDNHGMLVNEQTAEINNGKAGHDWSAYRDSDDLMAQLQSGRQGYIGDAEIENGLIQDTLSRYIISNDLATELAQNASVDKQIFLSAFNEYITAAEVDLQPSSFIYADTFEDSWGAMLAARGEVVNLQREFDREKNPILKFKLQLELKRAEERLADVAAISLAQQTLFQNEVDSRVADARARETKPSDNDGLSLRDKEAAYAQALNDLTNRRDIAADLYADIDAKIKQQADTGVGLLVNRDGALLENQGKLTNYSLMLNEAGGEIYNHSTAADHSASLNNDGGYIRNHGLLVNQQGAQLDNTGVIDNGLNDIRVALGVLDMAQLVNLGELNNDGELINNDTLVNYGAMNNGRSNVDAVFVNNGSVSNLGELTNTSSIRNNAGAELTNHGTVLNDGVMTNDGVFNNGQQGRRVGVETAIADAKTFYENTRRMYNASAFSQGILNSANLALDSVNVQQFEDEDGNIIEGLPFINLAKVASANSAELVNNGTFDNRGIFNNVGALTNAQGAEITNSGILMNGDGGVIDNAGTLSIEKSTANGFEQTGLVVTNGSLNNTGTVSITAGGLYNGTMPENGAVINNSGVIALSADPRPPLALGAPGSVTDPNSFEEQPKYDTAYLYNGGLINNQRDGLIRIGTQALDDVKLGLTSTNTFVNTGEVSNQDGATIQNYGALINTGLIDNQVGSTFASEGTLQNTTSGEIRLANDTLLEGYIINDGLINISDDELLTMTGDISGSGTFAGNVLLKGECSQLNGQSVCTDYSTSVNPGNSPGLLTFDGDLESSNVDWVMEIWGTERGVSYDGVDILGDFTMSEGFALSILSWLDFDALISQEFTYMSIAGDLYNAFGNLMTSTFEFIGFSDEMGDNWAGTWVNTASGGWDLNLSFVGNDANLYDVLPTIDIRSRLGQPTSVPEPESLALVLAGLAGLFIRRRVSRHKQSD